MMEERAAKINNGARTNSRAEKLLTQTALFHHSITLF